MACFICNKSTSDKKISKKVTEYCNSCDYHKTKDTQKFSKSYEEEFWINSDYSEFTGTDFTDKKVNDLVLTFESWYSYFKKFLSNKKTILDIGSGTGVSCILLEKKGYQIIGVDPDKKNSDLINSKLEKGKCLNCFFEDLKIDEKVDVIWITHVLEHLPNPTELLLKCKEWLKKDGIICIVVPDCQNPEMLDASVNNPYHIFHFTKKALRKIFEKIDFELIECDSLANLHRTNRRVHKVAKKIGLNKISESIAPYYPFEITTDNNGYEIRAILKLN